VWGGPQAYLIPSLKERRGNSALRCSDHAEGMIDPALGRGWGPSTDGGGAQNRPTPNPSLQGREQYQPWVITTAETTACISA
jgi:hypothetical protein